MSNMAKMTLMFVVFVDLISQGLVFPMVNALIMETSSGSLSGDTAIGHHHFYYGLLIGIFFLAWFVGVIYVSKVSDSIGRKKAPLICLAGALAGYAITIRDALSRQPLALDPQLGDHRFYCRQLRTTGASMMPSVIGTWASS